MKRYCRDEPPAKVNTIRPRPTRLRAPVTQPAIERLHEAIHHHLGVDTEITEVGLPQQHAHRVGHTANPDLQAGAVLDLGGDMTGDPAIDLAWGWIRDLGRAECVGPDYNVH